MAKFYIQLEDKLLKISGDLTVANISKALGYVPVSPNVTNELSQRVDNITFDSLKDNPFLQDGSGELNIVDEAGNIIAKINADGIHSVDFIAGEHRLSDKTDKTYVDEALKNVKVDLTGYATEEWVNNKNYATEHDLKTIDFSSINNVPLNEDESGELNIVDESGNVGMKVSSDAVYAKDFISGEHRLSEKSNKSDIPTKLSQLENDSNFVVDDIYPNGVYAVTANEELIDYNEADNSCIGVALVAGEHKFMIAKSDATDGTNTTLYWGKNLFQKDVAGITNISSGADPVVDFNGAANTAAIIAGYTEHGVSMFARDMCTVLNTFNTSDSYNDWYVPAAGQLALMYLAKTDINAALANIGGTAFESSFYLSSSEYDIYTAWGVNFDNGFVNYGLKNDYFLVRFVRDISVKSLKERVSELESKIKDLNTSGSGANVQAVDTGDIVEDVNVEYATTAYVDGLIGDINTILESIINGNTSNLITFTVNGKKYQAEEGMTWLEFINSKYNDGKFTYSSADYVLYNNKLLLYGASVSIAETIIANRSYINESGGGLD